MNGNTIHGAPKKGREWRIGEQHYAITSRGSRLEGGGHMNENAIHGAPKRGREIFAGCTWTHTLGF